MNKRRIIGVVILLLGILLLINTQLNLTGNAISSTFYSNNLVSNILGFLFFFLGLIILIAKSREFLNETGLVKIITTPRFERLIKRHPRGPIENAIRKIGTGKGQEERLKGEKDKYSIRVTSGERLIFKYNPAQTEAYLIGYTPEHNYDRT